MPRSWPACSAEGEQIGRGEERPHPRVNLEFVSVNPNGPLHVGHGRYAAYGDALVPPDGLQRRQSLHRVLHQRLRPADGPLRPQRGRAVRAVLRSRPAVPADGYQGEYVKDVAATIRAEVGDRYVAALSLAAAAAGAAPAVAGRAGGGDLEDEDEEPEEAEGQSEWPADPAIDEAVAFFRATGLRPHARRDAGRTGGLRGGVRLLVQRDHAPRGRGASTG